MPTALEEGHHFQKATAVYYFSLILTQGGSLIWKAEAQGLS